MLLLPRTDRALPVLWVLAAYENLVKTQRLRQEMSQAKKDVEQYMGKVEEALDLKKMESRKGAGEVAAEQAKVGGLACSVARSCPYPTKTFFCRAPLSNS